MKPAFSEEISQDVTKLLVVEGKVRLSSEKFSQNSLAASVCLHSGSLASFNTQHQSQH
jgi:hypothetical protein